MKSEENEKFQVNDRRPRFDEGPATPTSPPPSSARSSETRSDTARETQPPDSIDFAGFVLSLGTSALIHLGEEADPISGKKGVRLERAREVIDLLALLEEKTKGNLTGDEADLTSRLLFTLRMKFVETEKRTR